MNARLDPATYVPFSARYGVHTRNESDRPAWWSRHTTEESAAGPFRCACPGTGGKQRCADHATQEDRLCDACRDHCWAIDDAKVYHRLINVHPPRSARSGRPVAHTEKGERR